MYNDKRSICVISNIYIYISSAYAKYMILHITYLILYLTYPMSVFLTHGPLSFGLRFVRHVGFSSSGVVFLAERLYQQVRVDPGIIVYVWSTTEKCM